ncbi:uncharacterized protein LDX57_011059 [Aspergillus melleus]|uniref:uncharacterized protein n=1 Tax=Aspergillus melleus TaxID=138277 RepID=UPI001E8D09EC|nr:uncharacterized protein LDX57_011059 [Aspergillus melleus]KAH8433425.1 hypothetical protein LDX57_011059 [Aspergillus melleus]
MDIESKQVAQQSQVDRNNNKHGIGDSTDTRRSDPDQGHFHGANPQNSVEAAWNEEFLVTFNSDDLENPLNWSRNLKWGVTAAVPGTGLVRIMISTMMAPAAYPEHVSLASAATQVLRSLLVFAFPLFAEPLYSSLGYGWGE